MSEVVVSSLQLELLGVEYRDFDDFCRTYEMFSIPENPLFNFWETRKPLVECPHLTAKECDCLNVTYGDGISVERYNLIVNGDIYEIVFTCIEPNASAFIGCVFYDDKLVVIIENGEYIFPHSNDENFLEQAVRQNISSILSTRRDILYEVVTWKLGDILNFKR